MHFDIIIIGSGPAASSAAMHAHAQSFNVLLLAGRAHEQGNDIQPSESIHPGTVSALMQLGLSHCVEASSQGVYEGIEAAGQYNALGEDEHGVWQGHHVNRVLFDAALLNTVKQQGITVWENVEVTELILENDRVTGVMLGTGQQVNATYVIDATGQKRLAGKQLAFEERFYSPPLVVWTGVSGNIPGDAPLFEKKCAKFIPQAAGWTWLAPEPPGRCTWTRLERKGKQQFLPPNELEDYPVISGIKTANRRWRVFRPVCKEGILLCGDAAGIIDPAAGQGILNAVISAVMAVRTVVQCINDMSLEGFHLARYDDWFINDYQAKVKQLKQFYGQHGIIMDGE